MDMEQTNIENSQNRPICVPSNIPTPLLTVEGVVEEVRKRADSFWETSWTDGDTEWLKGQMTTLIASVREEALKEGVQLAMTSGATIAGEPKFNWDTFDIDKFLEDARKLGDTPSKLT